MTTQLGLWPAVPYCLPEGMGTEQLRRHEWNVRSCPAVEAKQIIVRWHYSKSTANTAVASHGLYYFDSQLVGAALWMPPLPPAGRAVVRGDEDWRGVLVLSRLAIAEGAPRNSASFLLGRSMRLIDRDRWPILLTYADTYQGHTGGIYRATNWTDEGLVPAGDVWVGPAGEQRGRRRGPVTLSATAMRAAGCGRLPRAMKRRFPHRLR